MQIKNLKFQNFMSYEFGEISLMDRGLVCVEGENHDDGGSNGSGKSTLFEALLWCNYGFTSRGIKGDDVTRDYKGEAFVETEWLLDSGSIMLVRRYRGHSTFGNQLQLFIDATEITGASSKETSDRIQEYLQLDRGSFTSAVLFPQGGTGFAAGTDADQKYIFEQLLSFQRFSLAQTKAKDGANTKGQELELTESKLTSCTEKIAECKERLTDYLASENTFLLDKKKATLDIEMKITDWQEHKPELQDGIRTELAGLNIEIMKVDPPTIRAHMQSCEEKILELTREKAADETMITVHHNRLVIDCKLLEDFRPILGIKVDTETLGLRVSELREKTVSVTETLLEAVVTIKNLSARAAHLSGEISDGESLVGTPCGNCGRIFTVESTSVALKVMIDEVEQSFKTISEQEALKVKLEMEKTIIQDELADLEEKAEIVEKQIDAKNLKVVIDESSASKQELEAGLVLNETKISDLEGQKEQQNKRLLAVHCLETKQSNLIEAVARHERDLITFETEWARLQDALKLEEEKKSPYVEWIAKEKITAGELKKEYTALLDQCGKLGTDLDHYKFWTKGFGNRGVKSLLLDLTTPFLNNRANDYLSYLSPGAAKVTFSTTTKLSDGTIRDKFNVGVEYLHGAGKYGGISGGEKRRADIAILMALGDLVSSRSLSPIQLRLLDEPFESLDSAGNEQVVNLLREKILPITKTILVMTHDESLKQLFDSRIVIIKENGISRIEEEC